MDRRTSGAELKDHGDQSNRNNNLVKDDSSEDEKRINDNSTEKVHDEFPDIKSEHSNKSDEVKEKPRMRLNTLIKQKTLLNTLIGAKAFKDIVMANSARRNDLKSFQHMDKKDGWKFCIFEMGKKRYHLFNNKLQADYNNIPISSDDETLMI
jgi:hypothetical protein